jgi:hypothetical protein
MKLARVPLMITAVLAGAMAISPAVRAADALSSWNDGMSKQSVVDFVSKVTKEGGP